MKQLKEDYQQRVTTRLATNVVTGTTRIYVDAMEVNIGEALLIGTVDTAYEVVVMVGIGSIRINRPLTYTYPAGTIVKIYTRKDLSTNVDVKEEKAKVKVGKPATSDTDADADSSSPSSSDSEDTSSDEATGKKKTKGVSTEVEVSEDDMVKVKKKAARDRPTRSVDSFALTPMATFMDQAALTHLMFPVATEYRPRKHKARSADMLAKPPVTGDGTSFSMELEQVIKYHEIRGTSLPEFIRILQGDSWITPDSKAMRDYRRVQKNKISDAALGISSATNDEENGEELQKAFRQIQVQLGEKMQKPVTTSHVELMLARLKLQNGAAGLMDLLGEINGIFMKLPNFHQTAIKTHDTITTAAVKYDQKHRGNGEKPVLDIYLDELNIVKAEMITATKDRQPRLYRMYKHKASRNKKKAEDAALDAIDYTIDRINNRLQMKLERKEMGEEHARFMGGDSASDSGQEEQSTLKRAVGRIQALGPRYRRRPPLKVSQAMMQANITEAEANRAYDTFITAREGEADARLKANEKWTLCVKAARTRSEATVLREIEEAYYNNLPAAIKTPRTEKMSAKSETDDCLELHTMSSAIKDIATSVAIGVASAYNKPYGNGGGYSNFPSSYNSPQRGPGYGPTRSRSPSPSERNFFCGGCGLPKGRETTGPDTPLHPEDSCPYTTPKSTGWVIFEPGFKNLTPVQAQNVWQSVCKYGLMKGMPEDIQRKAWSNVESAMGKKTPENNPTS
jgi:hypothetical protein